MANSRCVLVVNGRLQEVCYLGFLTLRDVLHKRVVLVVAETWLPVANG